MTLDDYLVNKQDSLKAYKEKYAEKSMTLDEYKEMLAIERVVIVRRHEEAKSALAAANATATTEFAFARSSVAVWDAKLDMICWMIQQADKIEAPKARMREFL